MDQVESDYRGDLLWWLKVDPLKLAADWYADYRQEFSDEGLV